jgi:hypothetical protein
MKKIYSAIRIEPLGNLSELTQGALGGYGDGASMMRPAPMMMDMM